MPPQKLSTVSSMSSRRWVCVLVSYFRGRNPDLCATYYRRQHNTHTSYLPGSSLRRRPIFFRIIPLKKIRRVSWDHDTDQIAIKLFMVYLINSISAMPRHGKPYRQRRNRASTTDNNGCAFPPLQYTLIFSSY